MTKTATHRIDLSFENNRLLPLLFGEHDVNLSRIEHQLGVMVASRGNSLSISGAEEPVIIAEKALLALWDRLQDSLPVGNAEVDAAVRMARAKPDMAGLHHNGSSNHLKVKSRGRPIAARTPTQALYMQAMEEKELIFALGPAGTGKTFLAVAQAVSMLQAGQIDRIILSRPAVEAGERLGFLPGDIREKIDPYLRPIYDSLNDLMPPEVVEKRLAQGQIEIAPLAFMRGRTLAHAFIVLDEAQNTTPMQMKMALTRLGEGSRMVVTGDLTQIDLPPGTTSGLNDALAALQDVSEIGVVHFNDTDVVRHHLVARIVRAYDQYTKNRNARHGS